MFWSNHDLVLLEHVHPALLENLYNLYFSLLFAAHAAAGSPAKPVLFPGKRDLSAAKRNYSDARHLFSAAKPVMLPTKHNLQRAEPDLSAAKGIFSDAKPLLHRA
jgi:hypothetical protein